MTQASSLPTTVYNAVREVLALYAHQLWLDGWVDSNFNKLSELESHVHKQSEEETSLLDIAVVVLLNTNDLNDDPSKQVKFGTGLGGSFFDVPGEGRFSIMNYFDPNWRAGGGSSELPQITDIGVYLEHLEEMGETDLSFLGLIKAATEDHDTELTHLDFIEDRHIDYLESADSSDYED